MMLILPSLGIRNASATHLTTTGALSILSPSGGDVVPTTFHVNFNVTQFTIQQPGQFGVGATPNSGHIHVLLDEQHYTEWTSGDGIPFINIQPGSHEIFLRLVDNTHGEFTPDVNATVTVMISDAPAGSPSLTILSPADAATVNSSFTVSFILSNFILTPPHGQPDALKYGHIHVFVDNNYWNLWASSEGIPLTLPAGTHNVRLELVNTNRTPLLPAVSRSISVTVADPLAQAISVIVTGSLAQITSQVTNAVTWALLATIFALLGWITALYVVVKVRKIK